VGQFTGSDRGLWPIPSGAEGAWLALQARLEDAGTVPCQESDVAAWWPDTRELKSPATRGAIAGCRRCPAQIPCAEYAVAADERFGVWGATTPQDRRAATRGRP
jgi:hypothetical protein